MRTAIVFFSHLFDLDTLIAMHQLRHESKDHGTFYVLTDRADLVPEYLQPLVHVFDFAALKREFPQALGETVVPGNCHLAILDFVRHHNGFDNFWVIEYDVRFTGNWNVFFDAFADDDTDFMACAIRRRQEMPDWYWWPTLAGPGGPVSHANSASAFLPVQRLSRQAVTEMHARLSEGWSGHSECLLPTILLMADQRVVEIGGDGERTPPHRHNRFYTSETMRWRPPHDGSPRHRDMLYHPVKPGAGSPKVDWTLLLRTALSEDVVAGHCVAW